MKMFVVAIIIAVLVAGMPRQLAYPIMTEQQRLNHLATLGLMAEQWKRTLEQLNDLRFCEGNQAKMIDFHGGKYQPCIEFNE